MAVVFYESCTEGIKGPAITEKYKLDDTCISFDQSTSTVISASGNTGFVVQPSKVTTFI